MAKTSTGRVTPAKVKAPPKAAAGKPVSATPAKKAAAVKAPAKPTKKPVAPKMVAMTAAKSAPTSSKTVAVKGRAAPIKPTIPGKTAAAKAAMPRTPVAAKKPAPMKKAVAPKAVTKTVAVKKAAPRRAATRVAVPMPAPRRARPPARKVPAPKPLNAGPQVFTVSHLKEADFKADGLRAYAHYRDLGIAAATGGLCQAHVIRLISPCTQEVRKRHQHQADLQLVYVLKGWMKNEFEGHGEQMMSVGSCWLQPSGIRHTVLDYSADCEVLEIIVPADFKTEETT
jgi:uncharacterized RmlC-like cupin family protein